MATSNEKKEYDFSYLKDTIGTPLTNALTQLALHKPKDPVDYIGNYLLQHVKNIKNINQHEKYLSNKKIYDDINLKKKNEKNQLIKQKELNLKNKTENDQKLFDSMKNSSTLNELYHKLLNHLIECTNASSGYIGKKIKDNENDQYKIHWIFASDSAKNILDQYLTEDNGISFDTLIPIVNEENNNEENEDDNNNKPILPSYIHIPNVIREPRIKFYDIPKLGAYLVRAFNYNEYLHDDNINFDEPKPIESTIVIGLNTMGQAREFNENEINLFTTWTDKLCISLEECVKNLWKEDQKFEQNKLNDFENELKTKLNMSNEKIEKEIENLNDNDNDDKELKKLEIQLTNLTEILFNTLDSIDYMTKMNRPYNNAILLTFSSLLSILGLSYCDMFNVASNLPDWNKIKFHLNKQKLQEKIEKFNPPSSLISDAEEIYEKITVDLLESTPIIKFIYQWIQIALSFSKAIIEQSNSGETNEEE